VRGMAEAGEVIVRVASAPIQIIDVRDLDALLRRCAAAAAVGVLTGSGLFAPTASLLAEITPSGVMASWVEVDSATLSWPGSRCR
jgi:hypothetical protein